MPFDFVFPQAMAVLGFLLALAATAHMLRQRRSPTSTIAWFLAMMFMPYVGVPLYLMIGGRKFRKRARKKRVLGLRDVETVPRDHAHPMDKLLRTYRIPGAVQGNSVAICRNGEETYERLVALIESARENIHIATFILHPDEVGKDILRRLSNRAAGGVKVRLLLDGLGSFYTSRRYLRGLVDAGGEVSHFIPVFRIPLRGRTNLRNHRKLYLADGSRALVGGANIAKEYIGPTPYNRRWTDLMFQVEGPAVQHLEQVFRSDWQFASEREIDEPLKLPEPTGLGTVQVVPSGPDVDRDPLYDAIMSAAFDAQERLWVVTPYFIPDDPLAQAFTIAAQRGVDLRLFLPERSNHPMADLARGTFLRQISDRGGKVFFFRPGMMHAKAILLDRSTAIVGSANIDMRSLFLNYEIALFFYSRGEIEALEQWILTLAKDCHQSTKKVNALQDWGESLVRMMSPLL
ncbi:MAG: cardiolipin synthase [Candidatus Hydrogenedentales bacterium]